MTQVAEQTELRDEPTAAPPVRKNRKPVDDEMDITPMIDITFLLLIFFLVASTPDQQTAIELPEASSGSPVSQLTSTVFTLGDGGIDIAPLYQADGKVEQFRMPDDLDERKAAVKEAVEKGFRSKRNKTDAIIKADKTVRARDVNNVIKGISQVEGITIHLAILESQ